MIHLDTSFFIRALLRDTVESRRLRAWVSQHEGVRISAIAWAEFVCGPVSSSEVEDAAELLGEPVPLTGIDASVAARLFNDGGRRRGSLADCMIAATAMNAGALLATSDRDGFEKFLPLGLSLA